MGSTRRDSSGDLFVGFVSDFRGRTKSLQDVMTRNLFSLSTKRKRQIEHYFGKDKKEFIRIYTAGNGVASIFDNDFLLFAITQLRRRKDSGEDVSNGKLIFSVYDYLLFRHKRLRGKGSRGKVSGGMYKDLWDSLLRLQHTHVHTSITSGGRIYTSAFSWLAMVRKVEDEVTGKIEGVEVQLCDWLVGKLSDEKSLLSFSDDYFDLRGGLERWLFLFCRKACGMQRQWRESIASVHLKSASEMSLQRFTVQLRKIVAKGALLDYAISIDDVRDELVIKRAKVYVIRRENVDVEKGKKFHLGSDKFEMDKILAMFDEFKLGGG